RREIARPSCELPLCSTLQFNYAAVIFTGTSIIYGFTSDQSQLPDSSMARMQQVGFPTIV
ncbi:MAG: hypothetical protein EZS28_036330, partial [Streblomastix strix]